MSEEVLILNQCQICRKSANRKCKACQAAYYCSKQHQKDDYKTHKKVCAVFKVGDDNVVGRHLIATRVLKPGETVIREPPIIWGPSNNSVPICLGCGKNIDEKNSKPCLRCGWPVCGDLCAKSTSHLPECLYTTRRGEKVSIKTFGVPHPIYRCIIILRCLYQKRFLPRIWKKLENIEPCNENVRQKTGSDKERIAVAEFIRRFFKLYSIFSEDEIMRVIEIITISGHEVPFTEPHYVAIYNTTSKMRHSCIANCSKSFTSDGQIVITVTQPTAEGDHLTICYTDPLWGTLKRRHLLKETKFFWCRCTRCEDPTEFGTYFSALKCQNKLCDGLILPKSFVESQTKLCDWICNKCMMSVSPYYVHDILERIELDFYDLDKNNVTYCNTFFKTYEAYLPENHFYFTKINLAHLLEKNTEVNQLSEEDLVLRLQRCRDLIKILKTLAPSERETLEHVLFETHVSLSELARRKYFEFSGKSIEKECNLMESRKALIEAIELLKDEPQIPPQNCKLAEEDLKTIESTLRSLCIENQRSPTTSFLDNI